MTQGKEQKDWRTLCHDLAAVVVQPPCKNMAGLKEVLDEIIEKGNQDDDGWHKFDKDDETTWPKDETRCWTYIVFPGGKSEVAEQYWNGKEFDRWASHVITHWQPITIPSPPESNQ